MSKYLSMSSCSTVASRTCLSFFFFLVFPQVASAQPATLPFDDCFTGNSSQKMSVDTVYSQVVDDHMNITVFGQTTEEIVETTNTTTLAATLFTQTTTLTFNTFSNNSFLCDSLRPSSSLASSNSTYCPLAPGPYGLAVSIPFNPKNYFTTLNTELRALDPYGNEILCLTVATTPLQPGPLESPYGKARSIFWATIGLAAAYWIIVGVARVVSAWDRGHSRPVSGMWARVENAGLILVSAISGERLATSPSLLRFCSPSLRDIMIHTQWCAALAMVAVQWPPFVYPLLSQTAWATLTYNISLSAHATHWNPLDVESYQPPSDFADQLNDPSSILYLNASIPNTLFLLPSGTTSGMEAFAWSVGVRPGDLFRICICIFLAILAGTIALSALVWLIDGIFSRQPSSALPPAGTFSSPAAKGRSPRQSGGSKDMLDVSGDEGRSLSGYGHSYPLFRRRWFRPNLSSFHSSVLVGNLVRVLSFFHLPVTIFSSYQFSTAKDGTSIALATLSFTFFSVLFPGFLILRLARTSTTKLYDETRTLLALGPLYNHFRPDSQMFSSLLFLSNLINGIVIGCGQRSGTAQAIVILVSEVASALVTSVWLPWGTGAGMGLLSFLFCVARIVTAVLLVILTPTISIGAAASGWVAYGILVVLLLVYVVFMLILFVKITEALVRIFGCIGFDRSPHPVDSGLVGVLGLLGCCGGSSRRGRDRRRYRATEVRHSAISTRNSFGGRDSSSYVPPNASFAQHAKGSAASHHSGGPPPSVLRPEHALRPYREDSDDDDESTHIMGAWQPFPGPGSPRSHERAQSMPPQASSSGFSRVGGGRAHYDSPYAIAGTNKAAGGSTLTFPSVERRGSALGAGGGSSPRVAAALPQEVGDEVPTPMTSVANVARLPVLTNSGLPPGAMMPHARTKSQTAIIVGELAAMAHVSSPVQESHPMLEPEGQARNATTLQGGTNAAGVGAYPYQPQPQQHPQPPKKKGWFNIRRNRRHSDSQILVDATEAEDSSTLNAKPETGRSFVVIRDRKPLSAQPHPDPQGRKASQSLDESSPKPSSSFVVIRGSTSNDAQRDR